MKKKFTYYKVNTPGCTVNFWCQHRDFSNKQQWSHSFSFSADFVMHVAYVKVTAKGGHMWVSCGNKRTCQGNCE